MTTAQAPSQDIINDFVGNAHGNFARVQELYAQYPELLLAVASWNETAMGAATQMGRSDIVAFLREHGAPLEIFTAAMEGQLEQVQSMLQADPGLIHATGPHNIPLLYYPGIHGHAAVAAYLLAQGADITAGEGGYPPIHAAASFGQTAMARWYLAQGAPVNARDYDQKTPLFRALERGHAETAEVLRAAGGTEE